MTRPFVSATFHVDVPHICVVQISFEPSFEYDWISTFSTLNGGSHL